MILIFLRPPLVVWNRIGCEERAEMDTTTRFISLPLLRFLPLNVLPSSPLTWKKHVMCFLLNCLRAHWCFSDFQGFPDPWIKLSGFYRPVEEKIPKYTRFVIRILILALIAPVLLLLLFFYARETVLLTFDNMQWQHI